MVEMDLPAPPQPGERQCLRCNVFFLSPDRVRLRLCPVCRKLNEQDSGIRTVSSGQFNAAVRSVMDSGEI
jgi:hypothetical protein